MGDAAGRPWYLPIASFPGATPYRMVDKSTAYKTYLGLDLAVTKRLSHRWFLNASVTLQDQRAHWGDSFIDPTNKWAIDGKPYGNWGSGAGGKTWFVHHDADDTVDFDAVLGSRDYAVAYAFVYVDSPTARTVRYDTTKFSALRESVSAGEPLNPEIIQTWQKFTGTEIRDFYGQTESTAMIGNPPWYKGRIVPGSFGSPGFMYDIAILDDDGKEHQRR